MADPGFLSRVDWKYCPEQKANPDGLPWATHTGTFEIVPGVVLDCARLSNGMAVITEESMARFLEWLTGGGQLERI